MALVAAQVCQARAQGLTPGDGDAVVSDMAGVDRFAHFGQQFGHHGLVAAKTVAGQDQHVAAEVLHLAVGPGVTDANDLIAIAMLITQPQGVNLRLSDDGNFRFCRRPAQPHHQPRTGALGHTVHAMRVVARV